MAGNVTAQRSATTPLVQPASPPPPSTPPVTIVPFTTIGGATMAISDLEGAILQGGMAGMTYLGVISASRINADSICNQNGPYGSAYAALSVRNRGGEFGRIPSETSAFDSTAPLPPQVLMKNARIAYLSKNSTLGRGVLDPDLVFAALGCS